MVYFSSNRNSLLDQKDMGIIATAVAMPERIQSGKPGMYLVNLLNPLERDGLKMGEN